MRKHLIQCRELFGPEERQAELKECWKRNEGVFDEYTHPEGRPTFKELFALCKPGMVNVIMNSDLYMERLAHYPAEGEVWALSRYDVDPTGAAVLWNHRDSQDSWIIHGGPHDIDCPFPMGVPGVDNRLIWALQKASYVVSNPSKTIRTYHLHLSQFRSYLDNGNGQGRGGLKIERIPPPYAFAKPCEL